MLKTTTSPALIVASDAAVAGAHPSLELQKENGMIIKMHRF